MSQISVEELEIARSPLEFRDYVLNKKIEISDEENERHLAILKKGLYKQFQEEIMPLSLYGIIKYPPTYTIQPVLGNQGFVRDVNYISSSTTIAFPP